MFDEMSACLLAYLDAQVKLDEARALKKACTEPERPIAIHNEAELADYWARYSQWEQHNGELTAAEGAAVLRRTNAFKQLEDALPEGNIWFKLHARGAAWAVAKRMDDWGGWHTVIEVQPWSDDLTTPRDIYHHD